MKRITVLLMIVVILMAALPISASAGSNNNDGITLNYPNDLTDCKTNFHLYTYGVNRSWPVTYNVFQLVSGRLVRIGGGSVTGSLDTWFIADPLTPNTTETYAVFAAVYVPGLDQPIKLSGQWNVSCIKTLPTN